MTMPNVEVAPPPRMTAEEAAALRQLIAGAARNGEGVPALRALLKRVSLSPEQQLFVDMLLDTSEQGAPAAPAAGRPAAAADDDETEALRAELADLRQANDTMAAALGACPYCWGGDVGCRVCRGRGRPGYAPPDPALFHQFVVPALQRVRAEQRTTGGDDSRRAREAPLANYGGRNGLGVR
jgi:hypothetical protein